MTGDLTCEVHSRLMAVTPEQWRHLFPDLPDSAEMIQLVQDVGLDDFTFHSIVVRQKEQPILILPLFETQYPLAALANQAARRVIDAAGRWLPPRLFRPRLLGVGFVEGEWGQVGVDDSVASDILEAAWDQALNTLEALAAGLRVDLTAFVNFTSQSGRMIPVRKLSGFTELVGPPYGRVPITFHNIDEYIAGLSANTRSSLRRKIRRAPEMDVVRTRHPGPWLETIYRYYRSTLKHSEVVFGTHRSAYFERVCEVVPGAEYWLYFIKDQLLAFQLVVVTPGCLVDKYFGMDPVAGREHHLYFASWLESIRYCIDNRICLYHAGQAEEDTKARLGARFLPNTILFRHRQPVLHYALSQLNRYLWCQPKTNLPRTRLGMALELRTTAGGATQQAHELLPACSRQGDVSA